MLWDPGNVGDIPLTDNTSRAHESAAGESGIKDELSEAITLSRVHALVGEWVPFGSNQIVSLNEKRGAGLAFLHEEQKSAADLK